MIKVGLTGNIGSGKTLVAGLFSVLQVPLYRADVEAKFFFHDEEVRAAIVKAFGQRVLDDDNTISTRRLGHLVFNDSEALTTLNALIHPRVRDHFRKWLLTVGCVPYIIFESAILFESGFYRDFARIITVTAPEELRINRVMERNGMSRRDVTDRIRNQWSEAEKIKRADFVIRNDEKHALLPQVIRIHSNLMQESEKEKMSDDIL
jgi:dephospho-CoA kinase